MKQARNTTSKLESEAKKRPNAARQYHPELPPETEVPQVLLNGAFTYCGRIFSKRLYAV